MQAIVQNAIKTLEAERGAIDAALGSLRRLAANGQKRRGRPPAWMKAIKRRGRPPGAAKKKK